MSNTVVPFWEETSRKIEEELKDNYKDFYEKPSIVHTTISGGVFDTVGAQAAELSRWMQFTNNKPSEIKSVIEFGGGFGSMCQTLLPFIQGNYTIIDLPIMIKLQKWYLRKTNTNNVFWINSNDLDKQELTCDLFIARYSLNEAGEHLIQKILESKFFNANKIIFVFYALPCEDFVFDKFIPEVKKFGSLVNIDNKTFALFK